MHKKVENHLTEYRLLQNDVSVKIGYVATEAFMMVYPQIQEL